MVSFRILLGCMKGAGGAWTSTTPWKPTQKKICRAPDGAWGTPQMPRQRTHHTCTDSGVRKEGLDRNQGFARWPVPPWHPSPNPSRVKKVSLLLSRIKPSFMTEKNDKATDVAQFTHAYLIRKPANDVTIANVKLFLLLDHYCARSILLFLDCYFFISHPEMLSFFHCWIVIAWIVIALQYCAMLDRY